MVDIPSNQPPSVPEPPKELTNKPEPTKAPHIPGSLKQALKKWRDGGPPSDPTHTQIKIESLLNDPDLRSLNGKQRAAAISSILNEPDLDPKIMNEFRELLIFHFLIADKELRS